MTPLVTIWLASALGAGLFFASGFYASRGRYRVRHAELGAQSTSTAAAGEVQALSLELERTRQNYQQELNLTKQALQQLATESKLTEEQLTRAKYAQAQSRQQLSRLEQHNAELAAHNQALEQQLSTSQHRAPQVVELQQRLASLNDSLRDEQQRRGQAEAQLARAKPKLVELTERAAQVARLGQELGAIKAQLAQAKADAKAAGERTRAAQDQAFESHHEALKQAQADRTSLIEQLAKAKAELAERSRAEQQLEQQELELAKASELAKSARQQLAERARALSDAEEKLRAAAQAHAELAGRISDLESQLTAERTNSRIESQHSVEYEKTTSSQRQRIDALEREQRELQVRNRMLTDRVSELKRYADENTSLRQARDHLESEVERLRQLRDITSSKDQAANNVEPIASRRPQAAARIGSATSSSGTTRRIEPAEHTLESHLLQHLNQLVQQEPGITAVLSDDNGFPVVGVGPEGVQEGVCVLTSLAHELATRAVDFVDLERIKQMELVDQKGRALRVRFFTWQEQELALGCLGTSHLQPNLDEERVVSDFPNVLLAASSA